uniref:Uncharacterized protein n=1 Tax=Leersia perrieri TaxID=77586 RepID=A0A0D9VC58_9ORYZ
MRRNDVVTIDDTGRRAVLYDPATRVAGDEIPQILGHLARRRRRSLRHEQDGDFSFEALLRYGGADDDDRRRRCGIRDNSDDCYWRPLPPPPYVHDAGGGYRRSAFDYTRAYAAAAGDGDPPPPRIVMSSPNHGTYSFDTGSATPATGRSRSPAAASSSRIVGGAWNISSSSSPPPPAHRGCKGFAVPEPETTASPPPPRVAARTAASCVVDLGVKSKVYSSHFVSLCVAKLYKVSRRGTCSEYCCEFERDERNFAILTGVEVSRGGGKLRIVKHKSCRYSFGGRYKPFSVTRLRCRGAMRRKDDKIVGVDQSSRRAILYDPAANTVRALPSMVATKFWTQSISVGDDLYLIETVPWPDEGDQGGERPPSRSFEGLIHHRERRPHNGGRPEDECYWPPLPPPPCVHAAGYRGDGKITGYAVLNDGSHILMSTQSYGTYSFDTASAAWSKAGDWKLPFRGHAEYVPDHGLWFGLSSSKPPAPAAHFVGCEGFLVPPETVLPYTSYVVHLGSGKLCVALLFAVLHQQTQSSYDFDCAKRRNFAVLTGVEVARDQGGKLHTVKHKSYRYSFGEKYIPTYLL